LKQPAAIAAVPLGLYVLHPAYRVRRQCTRLDSVLHGALLTAGFAAVLGVVAAILHRQGILAEAYYWTIADHRPSHFFWNRAFENTTAFSVACLPLVAGAVDTVRARPAWHGRAAERFALCGLVIVSAIGVAAGERFYPHYYIQLLPPLASLAAWPSAAIWRAPAEAGRWISAKTMGPWMAVTTVGFLIANTAGIVAGERPTQAGIYLWQHADQDARLFVWGQSPRVYIDAGLRPASRYIATFPLTGYLFGPSIDSDTRQRIVPGAWDNLWSDFAAHSPDFIVDTEMGADRRYAVAAFPEMAQFLAEDYRIVVQTADGEVYERVRSPLASAPHPRPSTRP
jgi:hypothetical protein